MDILVSHSHSHSAALAKYLPSSEEDGFEPGQTTYNITSAPSPALGNRTFSVDIGCVVGGSSAVNGMIFQRGTAKDYDIWGELASPNNTWSWDGILPYFKKGIQLTPPKPEIPADFNVKYDMKYWGNNYTNHSIFATYPNYLSPSLYPFYQALKNFPGIKVPEDSGSGETGMSYWMTSTDPKTGLRSYSRTGHWDNLNRANYDLLPGTRVRKVLFNGTTATGVLLTPRNTNNSIPIIAHREVILSAGTVHTPQILHLSGIGPAPLLQRAGIPVLVDLPGVGSNFQDHSYASVSFRFSTPPPVPPNLLNPQVTPDNLGRIGLGLSLSLPTVSPNFSSLAARYLAQDPAAYLPANTHPTIIAGYRRQQEIYAREMLSDEFSSLRFSAPSGSPDFTPVNIHPVSRGTILIDPSSPEDEPIVDYRAASNPVDIDIAVAGIQFLRRTMTTGELGKYNATEVVPGPGWESDQRLGEWLRQQSIPSVYHPVGTAAMMRREWGGVVDGRLRVYGAERLRVVDASVMSVIVAGTTSMSVYALAEKGADLIKEGW
jgi:choline dehydrogenase-like flavoprotein